MKAEVIIKEISVNSVKCYQGINDIQTTRKDRLGHFVQDILHILDLISGENTKMISVSQQSNPCELSLVTDRAALYSARPVCADDNQKESSDH